jgi:hypothetical protein
MCALVLQQQHHIQHAAGPTLVPTHRAGLNPDTHNLTLLLLLLLLLGITGPNHFHLAVTKQIDSLQTPRLCCCC